MFYFSRFVQATFRGSNLTSTKLPGKCVRQLFVVANKPHVSLSAYSFKNDNVEREQNVSQIRHHKLSEHQRDENLQMNNVKICNSIGTLHFIRFPTSEMNNFLDLCKKIGMADSESTICATGGGAIYLKKMFKNELNLKLRECDELASLIHCLIFSVTLNNNECYSWSQCTEHQQCLTQEYTFQNNIYPFIIVNIGASLSFSAVYGPDNYMKIAESCYGGELFLGICARIIKSYKFDEAIELATKGDNSKVDNLVEGEVVARYLAKMTSEEKFSQVSREDIARAALILVVNNTASNARFYANLEKIDRICFVGNFLQGNPIATKMLSEAMDYGSQKAIFLNHGVKHSIFKIIVKGYCGAIGSLLSFDERFKEFVTKYGV